MNAMSEAAAAAKAILGDNTVSGEVSPSVVHEVVP